MRVRLAIVLGTLAAFFLCASTSSSYAHPRKRCPVFQATFLQLWNVHDNWSAEQWDELCARLTDFGIQEVILQWTRITNEPFLWRLGPDRRKQVPNDPVEPAPAVDRFVRAANKYGLRVRFGLTHDPNWWNEIRATPKLTRIYLQRLFQDQIDLADTLVERYNKSAVFVGFYIPQEIDDKTWIEAEKAAGLVVHLKRLTDQLHNKAPGKTVAISSFFNGYDTPTHVTKFWLSVIDRSGLDALYVQDGIGAGKLTLQETEIYMGSLRYVAENTNARVKAIVEVFSPRPPSKTLDGSVGVPEGESALVVPEPQLFQPASMDRVEMQLRVAKATLGDDIIAFSLPEYATSFGGEDARKFGEEYLEYVTGLGRDCLSECKVPVN